MATQFNYRLPSGKIIKADINPDKAATVSVEGVLAGKIASPVPKEILEMGRQELAGRTPTFDPKTGVQERGKVNIAGTKSFGELFPQQGVQPRGEFAMKEFTLPGGQKIQSPQLTGAGAIEARAVEGVREAFTGGVPSGLTSAQEEAFKGIQSAFGAGGKAPVPGDFLKDSDPFQNIIDQLSAPSGQSPEDIALGEIDKVRKQGEDLIGSFDEELGKTRDLLADLDARIRQGKNREEARLAPMELITGRQAEIVRQNQADRQTLTDLISNITAGRKQTIDTLERAEKDILTDLGLRQEAQDRPLETLMDKLNIRQKIRDLTQDQIPNVQTSTYDDEGNLNIVLRDPNTGKFTTQTIKGVGKKSDKIENVRWVDDGAGNLMMVANVGGSPQTLGTIEGVGEETAEESQFLNRDYFKSLLTEDQLKAAAKEAGFTEGGFLGIGVGQEGIDKYLDYLEGLITQYRKAGFTDKEILNKMQ